MLERWRSLLDVGATVTMIVASGVLIWAVISARPAERTPLPAVIGPKPVKPIPNTPVSLEGAAVLGRMSAPVAVIEYSDFECPFCARFQANTLPTIVTRFVETGKLLFAFRHLPLERKHPTAIRAAEAAECSRRQGSFWPMHGQLLQPPPSFDDESLLRKAGQSGLDIAQFRTCMKGEAIAAVRRDLEEAEELSIRATPTFLFGRLQRDGHVRVLRHESGAIPADAFSRILESLIQKAGSSEPE